MIEAMKRRIQPFCEYDLKTIDELLKLGSSPRDVANAMEMDENHLRYRLQISGKAIDINRRLRDLEPLVAEAAERQ